MAISNTQGKRKLVRYNEGSLYPNVYQGKSNQMEMKNRSIKRGFHISHVRCNRVRL